MQNLARLRIICSDVSHIGTIMWVIPFWLERACNDRGRRCHLGVVERVPPGLLRIRLTISLRCREQYSLMMLQIRQQCGNLRL